MREGRWCLLLPLFAAACAGVSTDPRTASVDDLPPGATDDTARAAALTAADAAVAAYRSTRTGEATERADAALALDPRCGRALAVRALLQWRQAQTDAAAEGGSTPALAAANAAEAALRRAVAAAPRDAFAGLALATFLGDVDHLSAAAEAAEAALGATRAATDADRIDLLAVAAACRYELGEERAALPHLQACVAARPDDAATQYRLGATQLAIAALPEGPAPNSFLLAQRQAEAAARAFQHAFELRPDDAEAGRAVAAAWLRAADLAAERDAAGERATALAAATASVRTLAARFPADPEPWWLLGVIAERSADPTAAATAFDAALVRQPAHPGALLHRAALAEEAGDAPLAKALLQRALAADAAAPCLTEAERKRLRQRLAQP